jgi:hypothetical protein
MNKIILISLIVLSLIIIIFLINVKKEKYQPSLDKLPDELVLYSILKSKQEVLSFKDLVNLALTNKRYFTMITSFVRQITGVQNLKDLQNLKFFFGVPKTNKDRNIDRLFNIFQILNPAYIKLLEPSDRSNSLILDYSNLPIVETTIAPANWGFRYISADDDFKIILQKEKNNIQTKRIGIYLTIGSNPEFEERLEELTDNFQGDIQMTYRQNQQTGVWDEYARLFIFSVKTFEFDSSNEGIVFMLPTRLSSNLFDPDDEL